MNSFSTEVKKLLSASLPDLKSRYPISKLGLFGSIVREDFNAEKSDIDILVEFNGEIGWEFIDLLEEIEKILKRKVDLISKGGVKPRFWNTIKDDLIYV